MAAPEPPATVRAADVRDLDALVTTRIALFDELGQAPAGVEEREAFRVACRVRLAELLRDGRARAWVAEAPDGGLLGAAILLEYPRLPSPRNLKACEGYVLNVFVVPAARRQGLASRLVDAAIAAARALGLARIRLHATAAGRGVYARLGFRGRDDEMELVL